MKAVIQRVREASVSVNGRIQGEISRGLLVFVGITHADTPEKARVLADKVAGLRIFEDREGRMNRSVLDISGHILVISQFTLYADTAKGRRPSFQTCGTAAFSEPLYRDFVNHLRSTGIPVGEGVFGASMLVSLINEGPVTLILEA